jgi:hypothetical protein
LFDLFVQGKCRPACEEIFFNVGPGYTCQSDECSGPGELLCFIEEGCRAAIDIFLHSFLNTSTLFPSLVNNIHIHAGSYAMKEQTANDLSLWQAQYMTFSFLYSSGES